MPMEAHLTDWLNMLGFRYKVKEKTGVHIFMVVARNGCQWRHTSQTGPTCWDPGTIYKSKLEYGSN